MTPARGGESESDSANVRLARIEDRLRELARDVNDILREIGGTRPNGVGRKGPIRTRLHELENNAEASRLARAALDEARQAQAAAAERRQDRTFTRREKIVALVIAGVVAAGPYVNTVLLTRGGR